MYAVPDPPVGTARLHEEQSGVEISPIDAPQVGGAEITISRAIPVMDFMVHIPAVSVRTGS
jgi:hypothetical protein